MITIGLLMDGDDDRRRPTRDALLAAAADGAIEVVDAETAKVDPATFAASLDAVVIGPGGPYERDDLVLEVVRTARQKGLPLVAT